MNEECSIQTPFATNLFWRAKNIIFCSIIRINFRWASSRLDLGLDFRICVIFDRRRSKNPKLKMWVQKSWAKKIYPEIKKSKSWDPWKCSYLYRERAEWERTRTGPARNDVTFMHVLMKFHECKLYGTRKRSDNFGREEKTKNELRCMKDFNLEIKWTQI